METFIAALFITALNQKQIKHHVNRRMDKQTVVYSNTGILLSQKEDRTNDTCNDVDKCQKCYIE